MIADWRGQRKPERFKAAAGSRWDRGPSLNQKMVGRTPHSGPNLGLAPLPIGSADSADAEREKRTQRLDETVRRTVQGLNARMVRGNLTGDRSGWVNKN